MAKFEWDHTVHHVNDLENCIKVFQENGLSAARGGSHPNWGTYNALSYFGLCYVEFLGIENRGFAENLNDANLLVRDSIKLLPEREAFGRIALRTDDIEGAYSALSEKGVKVTPIFDGERLNAQGKLIGWRMMMLEGDFNGLEYPFIIQWNETDSERLAGLAGSGSLQSHREGGITVDRAVFHVPDPSAAASHWSRIFGLKQREESAALEIGDKSFIFIKGEQNRLTRLVFRANQTELKGRMIRIGEGEYSFI